MVDPYYDDGVAVVFHGKAEEVIESIEPGWPGATVMLTDPPFGIDYRSGQQRREGNARSIEGDKDTSLRDRVLEWWAPRAALVFGSPKAERPAGVRTTLIWDQDGALGMGDLSLPWKPSWQEVYVIGGPWAGTRDCGSVYRYPPVQAVARLHPHQKPVGLLQKLLAKCPPGGVLDPFMGSGSTLVAAKAMNRWCVGIEADEAYCEKAAKRLGQEVLDLGGVA